ncbi:DVUA0089 family protein [Oscillatoria sp. FACHB-1407]|uniref:DVUA0089 family protein n=1 Tax=Oscillatoria sp. FACHB-1407 TaxID=2692847 RepID=UPI001688A199|nr:DVUA0089 family protein [Oscillatoria sp. FACHB-1407]MBD2460961.1 DVUA0089 family protein [Oscillatoria sp. FACHB-1407]
MNTLRLKASLLLLAGTVFWHLPFETSAQAAVFYENSVGEAGAIPLTAMDVTSELGNIRLDSIIGSINQRADLYKIYIAWDELFLATTANQKLTLYPDTQLFLFDENGYGLFANDDTSPDDWGRYNPNTNRSTIRVDPRIGSGVLTAGVYYLGIAGYDVDPISEQGYIFPNGRRELYGPEDAVRSPLTNWQIRRNVDSRLLPYTITLKGARFISRVSPTPAPTPTPPPPSLPTPTPTPTPTPIPTSSSTPAPSSSEPSPSPSVTPSPSSPIPSPTSSPIPSPTPDPISSPTPDPDPVSVPEPSAIVGLLTLLTLGFGFFRKQT